MVHVKVLMSVSLMHVVIMPIARNTAGSYQCSCDSGYVGDGVECEYINECNDSNTCFDKNTECVNNDGGLTFPCLEGYSDVNGNCVDINDCLDAENCNDNTRCSNTDGSYECFCETGYVKAYGFPFNGATTNVPLT